MGSCVSLYGWLPICQRRRSGSGPFAMRNKRCRANIRGARTGRHQKTKETSLTYRLVNWCRQSFQVLTMVMLPQRLSVPIRPMPAAFTTGVVTSRSGSTTGIRFRHPGSRTPVIDPTGPERGTSRVIRGSSWRHAGFTEMRLSYRDYGTAPRADVGFRIARNVD